MIESLFVSVESVDQDNSLKIHSHTPAIVILVIFAVCTIIVFLHLYSFLEF